MADGLLPGMGASLDLHADQPQSELLVIQRALDRVLAFTGHSIDDVINDPFVRNRVIAYFKLHRWMERESQRNDLERQWNPLGIHR